MSNRQQRNKDKNYRRLFKGQQILFDDYLMRTSLGADGSIVREHIPPEDYIATSIEELPQQLQDKWKQLNE